MGYIVGIRMFDEQGIQFFVDGSWSDGHWIDYKMDKDEYIVGFHGKMLNSKYGYFVKMGVITSVHKNLK